MADSPYGGVTVMQLSPSVAMVKPEPGSRLPRGWVDRLVTALGEKYMQTNKDFKWSVLHKEDVMALIVYEPYEGCKVTLDTFTGALGQAFQAALLPELTMVVEDLEGANGFKVLFKGEVGDPAWPAGLTGKYHIALDRATRTATFTVYNQLHGSAEESEKELAREALQRAAKA